MGRLAKMVQEGTIKVQVDPKRFVGIDSIYDAIDHMYSGKNLGKVVVDIWDNPQEYNLIQSRL